MTALRLLGSVCESCSRSVKSPTSQILVCQRCSAICHDSPICTRGLLRSCPSSTTPSLDISRLTYPFASLSRQNWRCAGCHHRIGPPLSVEELPLLHNVNQSYPRPIPEKLKAAVKCMLDRSKMPETTFWQVQVGDLAGFQSPTLGPIQTEADSAVAFQATGAVCEPNMSKKVKPAHLCYYSGEYFCSGCHWGDVWPIPASIFVLGISEVYPVCLN